MIDLNKWVPIFEGGFQKDATGKTHDGDKLIDRAVMSFDVSRHEPPLSIGPVKDISPAFGWVKDLKKDMLGGAKTLCAKFSTVHPSVIQALKSKSPRVAASFYKDGRLRGVNLGGMSAPDLPGLVGIHYRDEKGCVTFEFDEKGNQSNPGAILDHMAQEILEDPGKLCKDFSFSDLPRDLTYQEAFLMVGKMLPELAIDYLDSFQ